MYVKVTDSNNVVADQNILTADVKNGILIISLDASYQRSVDIFSDVVSLELFVEEGGSAVGRYPGVSYLSTEYGAGGYFDGGEEIMVSTVRLHILTDVERAIRQLQTTQLEHDLAIAELYGG